MIPKKPAPDLIRGGNRFSDKIMLKKAIQRARTFRVSAHTASAGTPTIATTIASGQAVLPVMKSS